MLSFIQRTICSWFDAVVMPGVEEAGVQPASERFDLPHTFKPRLRFGGACVAVSQGLISIIAGSTLFGVCGATAWMALERIPSLILRVAALIPMVAVFLALLALLIGGISTMFRAIFPRVRF